MNRLDTLWQLQRVDIALTEAQNGLQEAHSRLGESQELLQARDALHQGEADLARLRSRLRLWELELDGLDSKIADVEDRLYSGRVTNPKELSSLQQDAQYLKRRQSSLEDDVLQAMAEIEEMEALVQLRREELEAIERAWSEEQERLRATVAELEARAKALSASRAGLCQAIAKEDLEIYEDLRRRRGQAVTALGGDLCQGCRVAVPTGKLQQAKRKTELVFCGGCGRILYVD